MSAAGVIYAEEKANSFNTLLEEKEEAAEPQAAGPPSSRERSGKKEGEMRTRMLMEDAEEDAPQSAKVSNQLLEDDDDDSDAEYERPIKKTKTTKKIGDASAVRRGNMFGEVDDDDVEEDDEYEETSKNKKSTNKTIGSSESASRGRPSKKSRGRPRKIVAERGEDSDADTEMPYKKPRGRPRKIVVEQGEDSDTDTKMPYKKPRGRPRKIVAEQGEDSDADTEMPYKKPRGQPCKIVAEQGEDSDADTEMPYKKPRGRPRKIVAEQRDDEIGHSDTKTPSKKSWGKPRKINVEDDEVGKTDYPRRPRGRPRKICEGQRRMLSAEEKQESSFYKLDIDKVDLMLFDPQFQQQHHRDPQFQQQHHRDPQFQQQHRRDPSLRFLPDQMHFGNDNGDVKDVGKIKKESPFYDPFQDPIYMDNAIKYEDSDAVRDATKDAVKDHCRLGGKEEGEKEEEEEEFVPGWLEEVGDEEEEVEKEMDGVEENELVDGRDECSDCGLMVKSAYLARHKQMSCGARENDRPRFKRKQKIDYHSVIAGEDDGDGGIVGDDEKISGRYKGKEKVECTSCCKIMGLASYKRHKKIFCPAKKSSSTAKQKINCKFCGKIMSIESYARHKKYFCSGLKAGDDDGDGGTVGDGEKIRGRYKGKEKVKCTACCKIMVLDSYTRHKKIFCPAKKSSTTTTTNDNLECPDCGSNFDRTSYLEHRRLCLPKRSAVAEEPRVAPERINCPNCGLNIRKDAISKHKRLFCPNKERESKIESLEPSDVIKNDSEGDKLDASNEDTLEPCNDSSSLNNDHGTVSLTPSNGSSNIPDVGEDDDFASISNGPSNSPSTSSALANTTSDSGGMVIKCQMCPFYVPYELSIGCLKILKQHHNTHRTVPKVPKVCKLCDYEAPTTRNLDLHTWKEHMNGKKNFQCTKCSFSTNYKKTLETHEISHTKDKALAELQCDQCGYRTLWKSAFGTHKLTHNKEKSFKCSFCDYATTTLVCLKTHTRYKHHVTERNFPCEIPGCGYRAKNKAGLVAHMASHMTDKPFKCSDCNFESTRKKTLRAHQRDFCPGNPSSTKNLQKSAKQQQQQQLQAIGFRLPKEENTGELPLPIGLDS